MQFDPEDLLHRFEHVVVDGEELAAKHKTVTAALTACAEALAPELRLPEIGEEVKVALTHIAAVVHAHIDTEAAKLESLVQPASEPAPIGGDVTGASTVLTPAPAPAPEGSDAPAYVDPTAPVVPAPPAGFTTAPAAPTA